MLLSSLFSVISLTPFFRLFITFFCLFPVNHLAFLSIFSSPTISCLVLFPHTLHLLHPFIHPSWSQLGEKKCTTSSPACQQRTSIVPVAKGKTKIILSAEIHSRNISRGKGSYPQETRKKKRNHVKTTTVTNAHNKMLFVTCHGFLIIFHILRKSFLLKLQLAVMLEAKL